MNVPYRASYPSAQGFSPFLGSVIVSSTEILQGRNIKYIKKKRLWLRCVGERIATFSLSVGHPFPISHWPLGTTSKPSLSAERRLTNSVREHPVGCEASDPQATARPQQLHTKPSYSAATQERERPFPPAGLSTHCLSWAPPSLPYPRADLQVKKWPEGRPLPHPPAGHFTSVWVLFWPT